MIKMAYLFRRRPDSDMHTNYCSQPGVRMARIAVMLTVLWMAGFAFADDPDKASPGWKGTDFSGADVDFPAVLHGKPTVMVFWATWCPYCRAFMPYLGEIQNDYGEDRINILTINVFEDGELDPAAYIDSLGYPMIAVASGDFIAEIYSVRGTPGLMILDGQGNPIWKRASTELPPGKTVAEFWSGQVREQLDNLL